MQVDSTLPDTPPPSCGRPISRRRWDDALRALDGIADAIQSIRAALAAGTPIGSADGGGRPDPRQAQEGAGHAE